ncbi:hypothetical protein BDR26DRAFT_856856 [Obelidium mucronatum]|nr:hypothetical protein BDR26DRAFT_856856 [Obelidium mucronatum]
MSHTVNMPMANLTLSRRLCDNLQVNENGQVKTGDDIKEYLKEVKANHSPAGMTGDIDHSEFVSSLLAGPVPAVLGVISAGAAGAASFFSAFDTLDAKESSLKASWVSAGFATGGVIATFSEGYANNARAIEALRDDKKVLQTACDALLAPGVLDEDCTPGENTVEHQEKQQAAVEMFNQLVALNDTLTARGPGYQKTATMTELVGKVDHLDGKLWKMRTVPTPQPSQPPWLLTLRI